MKFINLLCMRCVSSSHAVFHRSCFQLEREQTNNHFAIVFEWITFLDFSTNLSFWIIYLSQDRRIIQYNENVQQWADHKKYSTSTNINQFSSDSSSFSFLFFSFVCVCVCILSVFGKQLQYYFSMEWIFIMANNGLRGL